MQHKPSKVTVYVTDDYSRFSFIDGNRETTNPKKERIKKDIANGTDILDESPVLTIERKNRLDIIDGQNRFEIARELERPVHYIIYKKGDMSLYQIAKINSNFEKWTNEQFMNCYRKGDNQHYKKLHSFYNKYGISISLCLVLLTYGGIKRGSSKDDLHQKFKEGLFEVKTFKEACAVAEICKSFESFRCWNQKPFVTAICKIIEAGQAEMDKLLAKYNRDPKRLQMRSHFKEYLADLQLIYNIDNSKQRTIY
jgi:hypothetical protein